jgi:hypothetical protein
MDDEGLKRKSDKYAKNGEEKINILVDDIDRYEQLSNQEELLALASAIVLDKMFCVLQCYNFMSILSHTFIIRCIYIIRINRVLCFSYRYACDINRINGTVAETQNSVDTDNVDTSNDEGVRQDRH